MFACWKQTFIFGLFCWKTLITSSLPHFVNFLGKVCTFDDRKTEKVRNSEIKIWMLAMKWCWTTPQLVLRALIPWMWKMPFSVLFSTDHSLGKSTVSVMKILVLRELRSHLISSEPFPYDFSLPFLCFLLSLCFVPFSWNRNLHLFASPSRSADNA